MRLDLNPLHPGGFGGAHHGVWQVFDTEAQQFTIQPFAGSLPSVEQQTNPP